MGSFDIGLPGGSVSTAPTKASSFAASTYFTQAAAVAQPAQLAPVTTFNQTLAPQPTVNVVFDKGAGAQAPGGSGSAVVDRFVEGSTALTPAGGKRGTQRDRPDADMVIDADRIIDEAAQQGAEVWTGVPVGEPDGQLAPLSQAKVWWSANWKKVAIGAGILAALGLTVKLLRR
ncbi:MAG: hypothetical protein JSV86_05460 [Gemmatimonadota bacterium]|nr:MAG: hypothetical protein JSV86_05460 [Gemmatimonadota bacterium]